MKGLCYMKKYENFIKSLANLHKIYQVEVDPDDTIRMVGMTGLFTICFEQSWRAMKEYLAEEGWQEAESGSPRQIIKTAFEAGLITDGEGWLQAMRSRNLQTHTYNEEVALAVIKDTKEIFIPLFDDLEKSLKARMGE